MSFVFFYFLSFFFFFFNDTATTEIYTLSLHDALPIQLGGDLGGLDRIVFEQEPHAQIRSEEHTSELQSRFDIVCRLLLEKKKELISRRRPSGRTEVPSYRRLIASCD